MKISILGLGNVGSVLASHLIASDRICVDELNIYDVNKKTLRGNYYDLLDMRDVLGKGTRIRTGVHESDVYIITAGKPRKSSKEEWNYPKNLQIVLNCVSKCGNNSKIMIITNPVERITNFLKRMGYKNVIPVGKYLDAARFLRTRNDPEKVAVQILDSKGYTNFGVVAEVLKRLEAEEGT